MAAQRFRTYHDLVRVSLGGRCTALRRDTIRHCLPRLYRNAQPEISMGFLRPDRYTKIDNWWDRLALIIIFEYLKELERGHGVSGVLQTRLDSQWRNSPHSKTEAEDLFYSLCSLFKHFGCSGDIFHAMVSFFERHCREIVQRTPHGWLRYIQGLDRIRMHNKTGMTSALSCLLQYEKSIDSQNMRDLAEDRAVSPQTLGKLYALIEERKRRRFGSPLRILPPQSPQDLVRIRGGSQKINGSNLDPEMLLRIAESAPETLDYHPNRRSRHALYDDDDDDDYPMYSHNAQDCSDCDLTSPLHPISSRYRPRMLPPIDDASFDLFDHEFGRRLDISGVPVM